MDTSVKVLEVPGLSIISIISLIICVLLLGTGIYIIFLLIKALRLYIKKNS